MRGLHPIKIPSAKEQVVTELRKAILTKKFKEGEVISLESVATQLNVSAMPVREAFQVLARDGLIELRRSKGAVVLGITETYIREHYQVRAILESAATQIVSSPRIDVTEIKKSYENSCEMLEEEDFSQYANLNREFHNEIWTATGNSRMKQMISELWNGLSMGNMVTEAEYARISIAEHGRIMEAILAHDEKKAHDEMEQHIMRSMDDMLTYYV